MKKIIFLLLAMSTANAAVKDTIPQYHFKQYLLLDDEDDCDACGCSASGGSMGFASMLNAHFVGLRYFYQHYQSNDGLYSNSPWYDEQFNTVQIWARIPLVKKVQLSVLAPYHFHERETKKGHQNLSGLGDITLIGMYQLYQTHTDSTYFAHTLQVGAGVKLPTGKFNEANSGSLNPSFQAGTGSWDYSLATEYTIRHKKIGLNSMMQYIFKTANQKEYQFGNQFNYAATLFYLYEKNKYSLAPQLGIAVEYYQANVQRGQKLDDTAGQILLCKIGFEAGRDKLSFGFNFMWPLQQDLAGGNLKAVARWSLNLNYAL